jgi:hypothetical protein
MPTEYQVGDRVDRIEDREVTGATIISIQDLGETICVELQYDEGSTGWWPVNCIKPRVDPEPTEPPTEPTPQQ